MTQNDTCAHIDRRWLKYYRRQAKKSQLDMSKEVWGDEMSVNYINLIEMGEFKMIWRDFKRWAAVCGHTGGQISLYYLPYRNWLQRAWDRLLDWIRDGRDND